MQKYRTALFVLAMSASTGCVPNMIQLFDRGEGTPPVLAGHSVAVLPALTLGGEARSAVTMTRTARSVFADDIAGVHFTDGGMTSAEAAQVAPSLKAVREAIGRRAVPEEIRIKGESKTVLDKEQVGGVKRDRRQVVNLIHAREPLTPVGPDRLDVESLRSLGSDYVLLMASMPAYLYSTDIFALYGAIPFMGGTSLMELTPRAVFCLYDTQTGEKVWESEIGMSFPSPETTGGERGLPVVGAAYLLTGDVDAALGRWLDHFPRHP